MFKTNVGGIDRIARVVLGAALLIAYFIGPQGSYSWLFLLGVVPLVTGLVRSCPLYSLFGLSTCPVKQS